MGCYGIYMDLPFSGWWLSHTPLKTMTSSIGKRFQPSNQLFFVGLGKSRLANRYKMAITMLIPFCFLKKMIVINCINLSMYIYVRYVKLSLINNMVTSQYGHKSFFNDPMTLSYPPSIPISPLPLHFTSISITCRLVGKHFCTKDLIVASAMLCCSEAGLQAIPRCEPWCWNMSHDLSTFTSYLWNSFVGKDTTSMETMG